jgi:hypothetical protein
MYIVLEVGIPTDTDMDMDMDGRKPSALIESSCVWWKILQISRAWGWSFRHVRLLVDDKGLGQQLQEQSPDVT